MFRLVVDGGVTQRELAVLVRMSQSEVSEVLSGRRVLAYDVLVRIAEGLGVPRVISFGKLRDQSRLYLLRELVEGTSLQERIESGADARACLSALALAAEKLTRVHRAGLLHGDIKPANIIVSEDGNDANLVDLGLAEPFRGERPAGDPRQLRRQPRRHGRKRPRLLAYSIWAGVILAATSSRALAAKPRNGNASLGACEAARLNHMCARA